MFKNLFDLSVKRSGIGVIIALSVIHAKGIFNSFNAVLLTIIAVPLLYFGGISLGFIPVALLTSFDSKNLK